MCAVMHRRKGEEGKRKKREPWREEPQDMAVIEFIDQVGKEEGSGKGKYWTCCYLTVHSSSSANSRNCVVLFDLGNVG